MDRVTRSPLDPKFGLWLIPLVVIVVFVVGSFRTVAELKPDPPPEFIDVRREWDAGQRATEQDVARAYWACAVRVIQWRYPFGSTLPGEPPPEFNIEEKTPSGGAIVGPATRGRYWRKLTQLWRQPDIWKRTLQWQPEYFFASAQSLLDKLTL